MRKEERDNILRNISQEDRQTYNRVIGEVRSRRGAASPGAGLREALESSGEELPAGVRAALEAVIARDEKGPDVGEPAPDFFLKRRGSPERVRLSDFRGKRPVALVFGSYT